MKNYSLRDKNQYALIQITINERTDEMTSVCYTNPKLFNLKKNIGLDYTECAWMNGNESFMLQSRSPYVKIYRLN